MTTAPDFDDWDEDKNIQNQEKMREGVTDFLPPLSKLVTREATAKVTLELTRSSLEFFKRQAKQERVPYQRMIRGLIDAYARHQEARS
jgi:predicted DNA binding CopG/RHH family protein